LAHIWPVWFVDLFRHEALTRKRNGLPEKTPNELIEEWVLNQVGRQHQAELRMR
jgi:hypothetical protein